MAGAKTERMIDTYGHAVTMLYYRREYMLRKLLTGKATDNDFAGFQMFLREWGPHLNEESEKLMKDLDEEFKLYHKGKITKMDIISELQHIVSDIIIELQSNKRKLEHRRDLCVCLQGMIENNEELPFNEEEVKKFILEC